MLLRSVAILAFSSLFASAASAQSSKNAELIVTGGDIITVNELYPSAEAVAVRGGRIVVVGYRDATMKLKGPNTRVIDLGGKTLVPGFIDAHGHIFNAGVQALAANLLAAPAGDVKDVASLQDKPRFERSCAASAKCFSSMAHVGTHLIEAAPPRSSVR